MRITYGIFIINKDRDILACHPTGHKPTQWDIPKGIGEGVELPFNAMARELYEETGIVLNEHRGQLIDVGKDHGFFVYKHKQKQLYPFVYILNDTIRLDTLKCSSYVDRGDYRFPEVDSYSWLHFSDRFVLHETQQRVLAVLYNNYDIFYKTDYTKISVPEDQLFVIEKDNWYG